MNIQKIIPYLIIVIAIILCIPSILYLIENKTVDGFNGYDTYTLNPYTNNIRGTIEGILVIGFLLIISLLYLQVIKNERKIFKNRKHIFIYIIIVSCIFTLILPFLSSDIYYYIGDSWIAAKYGENPYYTTVLDLQKEGINDEILRNTGYWKNTTSIYGPLWNYIATALVSFSFGSVIIALFIFKITNLIMHLINTYLVYKLTKSNKYMLLYGLNPLVLLEFLSNVHNDIFLILFMLLSLYFLIRKKNIFLTLFFLALSISIKYSTILLVPFVLIYCFRKYKLWKKILYCIISGIGIIAFVALLYMPYYRDLTIFTNMLVQGVKYNQSIMLFLFLHIERNLFFTISKFIIPIFLSIYVAVLIKLLLKKDISFKEIVKKYNFLMLIFIFIVLATFQKWYILWLFPTLIWQRKGMRRFIIYLSVLSVVPSIVYFIDGTESFRNGNLYSTSVLVFGIIAIILDNLIRYIKNKRRKNVKVSFN